MHNALVPLVEGDAKCVGVNPNVSIPYVDIVINNQFDCSALLDTCSTSTFCTKKLIDKLGLKGKPISLELSTLSQFDAT